MGPYLAIRLICAWTSTTKRRAWSMAGFSWTGDWFTNFNGKPATGVVPHPSFLNVLTYPDQEKTVRHARAKKMVI